MILLNIEFAMVRSTITKICSDVKSSNLIEAISGDSSIAEIYADLAMPSSCGPPSGQIKSVIAINASLADLLDKFSIESQQFLTNHFY